MAIKTTIGLETIETLLKQNGLKPFDYDMPEVAYFKRCEERNPKYVTPIFSIINGADNLGKRGVLLISAAGATGKSELMKRLSYDLKSPFIDLGKSEVIGGNSLTGIIFNTLSPDNGAQLLKDLENGNGLIIIDALDEGYQKSNIQGFSDFLDDVIKKTSKNATSIIILGRKNAIDEASIYLEDKKIPTTHLHIEPFTIEKAKEFIRLHFDDVDCTRTKPFQNLLEHMLKSIGGFFKSQSEVAETQYLKFIGYAPVLMTISEFFNKNKNNLHGCLKQLQQDNFQEIRLIVDIVEKILIRDKDEKIVPNHLERLVAGRNKEFRQKAIQECYTPEEQCARVLCRIMNRSYDWKPTDDDGFNLEYEKGLKEWMGEHPFLDEMKAANIVFESYILAKLVLTDKYRELVYSYLENNHDTSYMFFYIFYELNSYSKPISLRLLPFLINSLKALDTADYYYTVTVDDSDSEDNILLAEFKGNIEKMKHYNINIDLDFGNTLELREESSDVFIEATNIDAILSGNKIKLGAPGELLCKEILINTDEIIMRARNDNDFYILDADCISIKPIKAAYCRIINHCEGINPLKVYTTQKIEYPLDEFLEEGTRRLQELTPELKELYLKLRGMLREFKCHSKDTLAKNRDKINNYYVKGSESGQKVLRALFEKGIFYIDTKKSQSHLYKIDNNAFARHLGISFSQIRDNNPEPLIPFLSSILSES